MGKHMMLVTKCFHIIRIRLSHKDKCLIRLCFSVLGGILAGLISDYSGGRATTCCAMLIIAAPMVSSSCTFPTFVFGQNIKNLMLN